MIRLLTISTTCSDRDYNEEDGLDSGGYAHVMSFDASSEAGVAPSCQSNIRSVGRGTTAKG